MPSGPVTSEGAVICVSPVVLMMSAEAVRVAAAAMPNALANANAAANRLDLCDMNHLLPQCFAEGGEAESFHMVRIYFLDNRIEFWTTKRCCDVRVLKLRWGGKSPALV
jgi:hypothetical protein